MKNRTARKTLLWMLPFTLLLLILGPGKAVDFQFHDTYLVVAALHLTLLLIVVILIIITTYWLVRKYRLLTWLSWIHIVFTSLIVLTFIACVLYQYWAGSMSNDLFFKLNGIITLFPFLLAWSQVLLIFNVIIGLVRGGRYT